MNDGRRARPRLSADAATDTSVGDAPDVEIQASACAEELRALEPGRTESEVTGDSDLRKEDFGRRENMPPRLEPGVVYKEIRIHRRIAGRLEPRA